MSNLKNEKLDAIQLLTKSRDYEALDKLEGEMTQEDWHLLRCYLKTLKEQKEHELNERDCINIDNSPADIFGMVDSLKKFDVKEITISERNTALMTNLAGLTAYGWKIEGLVYLTKVDDHFGNIQTLAIPALKLTK